MLEELDFRICTIEFQKETIIDMELFMNVLTSVIQSFTQAEHVSASKNVVLWFDKEYKRAMIRQILYFKNFGLSWNSSGLWHAASDRDLWTGLAAGGGKSGNWWSWERKKEEEIDVSPDSYFYRNGR